VSYKIVNEEISLVKAIMIVFASAGLIPTSNDVMFCSDQTPLTILESFIMRAMLFDIKIKS
jgi:hypothetical protein